MRANLAYILINRDGPAIQPGSRSYARSWIRDGALIAAALLRLGHADAVRDFLAWFAPYQFARRQGAVLRRPRAAPTRSPEHDSHGELIFLVAEYLRYTGDRPTVAAVWPHVARRGRRTSTTLRAAAAHRRHTAMPEKLELLRPAAPVDQPRGVLGQADALVLGRLLGAPRARGRGLARRRRSATREEAARWSAIRDEFTADLLASIAPRCAPTTGSTTCPGCADLGDFDATSTTIALWPAAADGDLPPRGARGDVRALLEEAEARSPARRAGTRTPRTRGATSARSSGSAGATAPCELRGVADGRPDAARLEPVARGRLARPDEAALPRRPAAHLGRLGLRPLGPRHARLRARRATARWSSAPASRRMARRATGSASAACARRTASSPSRCGRRPAPCAFGSSRGCGVPPGGIVLRPPLPSPARTSPRSTERRLPSPRGGEVIVRALPADVVIRPQTLRPSRGRGATTRGDR